MGLQKKQGEREPGFPGSALSPVCSEGSSQRDQSTVEVGFLHPHCTPGPLRSLIPGLLRVRVTQVSPQGFSGCPV